MRPCGLRRPTQSYLQSGLICNTVHLFCLSMLQTFISFFPARYLYVLSVWWFFLFIYFLSEIYFSEELRHALLWTFWSWVPTSSMSEEEGKGGANSIWRVENSVSQGVCCICTPKRLWYIYIIHLRHIVMVLWSDVVKCHSQQPETNCSFIGIRLSGFLVILWVRHSLQENVLWDTSNDYKSWMIPWMKVCNFLKTIAYISLRCV